MVKEIGHLHSLGGESEEISSSISNFAAFWSWVSDLSEFRSSKLKLKLKRWVGEVAVQSEN